MAAGLCSGRFFFAGKDDCMRIDALVGVLNRIIKYVLIALVLAMASILLLQIISRFVVFFPLPWSQELLQYMNIWMVFLGAGLAVKEGGHIRVELLRERFPKGFKRPFDIFSNALSLSLVVFVAVQAYTLVGRTAKQSFGSFPLAMSWFYLSLLLGCSLMAVNYVLIIVHEVSGMRKERSRP